jgi:hypothetical protein
VRLIGYCNGRLDRLDRSFVGFLAPFDVALASTTLAPGGFVNYARQVEGSQSLLGWRPRQTFATDRRGR